MSSKRKGKGRMAGFLIVTMLFSPLQVQGLTTNVRKQSNGLCKHHQQHNNSCGYVEAAPETACIHSHLENCYTVKTNCVHQHTDDCYPKETGSISVNNLAPSLCSHICSEDTGCVEKVLSCSHKHSKKCGYKEEVQGQPCTYQCQVCKTGLTQEQDNQSQGVLTWEVGMWDGPMLFAASNNYYGGQLTGANKRAYDALTDYFEEIHRTGTGVSTFVWDGGYDNAIAIQTAFNTFFRDRTDIIYWVKKGGTNRLNYTNQGSYLVIPVVDIYQGESITDINVNPFSNYYRIYLERDEEKRERALAKAAEIVAYAQRKFSTDYQKIRYFHEAICNLTYYDGAWTSKDFGDIYQMYNVFNGEPVVCEGYAKAFKYLCDESGIGCLILEGNMGGSAHMWNYVELDGNWYLVDVTNDDGRMDLMSPVNEQENIIGEFNETLLAVGSNNPWYGQLGFSPQTIQGTTNATLQGNDYQPPSSSQVDVTVEPSDGRQIILNLSEASGKIPTISIGDITITPGATIAYVNQENNKVTIELMDPLAGGDYELTIRDTVDYTFQEASLRVVNLVNVIVESNSQRQAVLKLEGEPNIPLPAIEQGDIIITPPVQIVGFQQIDNKIIMDFAEELKAGDYEVKIGDMQFCTFSPGTFHVTEAKPVSAKVNVTIKSFSPERLVLRLELESPSVPFPLLTKGDMTLTPLGQIGELKQENDQITITFSSPLKAGSYTMSIKDTQTYTYNNDVTFQIPEDGQLIAPSILVEYNEKGTEATVIIQNFNNEGDGIVKYTINEGEEQEYRGAFAVDENTPVKGLKKEISAYVASLGNQYRDSMKVRASIHLTKDSLNGSDTETELFHVFIHPVSGLKGEIPAGTKVANIEGRNIPENRNVIYQLEESEGDFKINNDTIVTKGMVGPGHYKVIVAAHLERKQGESLDEETVYGEGIIAIDSLEDLWNPEENPPISNEQDSSSSNTNSESNEGTYSTDFSQSNNASSTNFNQSNEGVGNNTMTEAAVLTPIVTNGQTVVSTVITSGKLEDLTARRVSWYNFISPQISFGFPLPVLEQLRDECRGGDIILRAVSIVNPVGKGRPVWYITIAYALEGRETPIILTGGRNISVKLPYVLGVGEEEGRVFALRTDLSGTTQWIEKSTYLKNKNSVVFGIERGGIYGIGYKEFLQNTNYLKGHWARQEILFALSRELFDQTGERSLNPDRELTREEFMKALEGLSGGQMHEGLKIQSSGFLDWNAKITREEMAVFIDNYVKATNSTYLQREVEAFKDGAFISKEAVEGVISMHKAGIISGKDGNIFDPKGKVTLAQGTSALRRLVEVCMDPYGANGWRRNDSGTYFYDINGKSITGWLFDEQKWYYFNEDGSMAVNTTVDGFLIGEDGARKEK